jgi:hypothetical protein
MVRADAGCVVACDKEVAMAKKQVTEVAVRQWARRNFADAPLPDARLKRRLAGMAERIAAHPEGSLPEQTSAWAETLAAYRLLDNDRVEPAAIVAPHVALTRERCRGQGEVLLVQDWTELTWTYDEGQHELLQHLALALDSDGQVLGILHGQWARDAPRARTRKQRRQRWSRSRFWPDTVEAVGEAPPGCRFITVADREADDFQLLTACRHRGHGFVIRAQHDRYINGGSDRLWSSLSGRRIRGKLEMDLPKRPAVDAGPPKRRRVKAQPARRATLAVRWASVSLQPPRNDPRFKEALRVWALWAEELDPPADAEPVQWMLLSSEKIRTVSDAKRLMGYYRKRWKIEELHKAQKTGCRLERSQLHDEAAFVRLAAIAAVVAVRLVELRDVAQAMVEEPKKSADDPATLRNLVDWIWIAVVAHLAQVETERLTPRRFYETLARQGGWLARKGDGPPGWQTLYRGWRKVAMLVAGATLFAGPGPPARCV